MFLEMVHIPVLMKETLDILKPQDGDRILDCTFGGGGHTRAILDASNCYVCAIDRDPDAEKRAWAVKQSYGSRFDFIRAKFSDIADLFTEWQKFDAVLFDFGISSFQVDEAERGFSFQKEAKLDMRMSKDGVSAYDVVNTFSEKELADIIWTYGEEPRARQIAYEIIKSRKVTPIETTTQLADIVHEKAKSPTMIKKYSKIDAATKTFQAIRMFVNDELREIKEALGKLPKFLNNGAKIVTISFHALEDRVVKNWAKTAKDCIVPMNKFVIKPTTEEIFLNPRSRSAVLRGFWYNELGDEKRK